MVVSAEKARQKAEARRQRILAKSAERMDVVSGLAPKGGADEEDEDEPAATVNITTVVEDVVVVEKTVESTSAVENDNIPSNSGGGGSKGARRMAAMRRRRYQNKKKEEEATNINDDDNEGKEEDGAVVVEKVDATNEEGNKESSEPALVEDKTCEPQENEENNDEEPPAAESIEDESSPSSSSSEPQTKKKYMGVARMRRKIIKEQKAQRIAELEAATDNSIDAAATMATLGMTASMIREGSGSIGGEVDLSEVAIKTLRGKKKWWKLVFPPMSLVPRLVTLMLLFMAGLDVGLEPHRARNATNAAAGGGGGENLIYHVESSFTKPWEYGMGGKARHMMGMMDAAPPTAMPTSFSREGFCVNGGSGEEEECVNLSTSKKKERGVKEKLLSENNEDEFAGTTDEHDSRPKGVSTSEFDDEVEETYTPPVIDPIFQVDLDALLQNSQLPAPINFAAKFAIGFHRMWVRYLWTVPTSILKSILYSPKTLITSWTANPPVFLFISLLIRVIGKVLVGNTPQEEDENDPKGKKSENLDILGKIKDTAVNYATSSFPKTILVLKTLKEVVTVDMYVILCGLLVGLVTPLVKQDLGFGEILMGGGKVLGDGEL